MKRSLLILIAIVSAAAPAAWGATPIHLTRFDTLTPGFTQPAPGVPGQAGWFNVNAPGSAFGEIQGAVALGTQALHQFSPATNPPGAQKVDRVQFLPPDLSAQPLVTLKFQFRARSSSLAAVNNFSARLAATGGPHPGYEIIGVSLGGGNGTAKSITGVNLSIGTYNGSNNNESATLTVGQNLAWEAWHEVVLALNQNLDEYLYLAVNGLTQQLAGVRLPRSDDAGVWQRGQRLETLSASLTPDDVGGVQTDDDIYWDNIELSVSELRSRWAMRGRDVANTRRADHAIAPNRQGTNFFDIFRWQKPAPGSPGEGNLSSSAMVFFDGAGPGGSDLVAGGYHWPKGVQGMDRQTGARFWNGNPDGGESIGANTPAFSPDGTRIYVINDATPHPLMGFASTIGPSVYWHNGADASPDKLGIFSPRVAPDGRIFASSWNDRPYAGTDDGSAIHLTWTPMDSLCTCYSAPGLLVETGRVVAVFTSGRCGDLKAFDGDTGATLWSINLGQGTDADVTVDPATGNIYVPVGGDSVWIAGLDRHGNNLWANSLRPVFVHTEGVTNPQRTPSGGCLSQDGLTYYFQTVSQAADGRLYAINTLDGSVKWSYPTASKGWDNVYSAPIVTPNGILVVGNNESGSYLALRDDGNSATLLDTLTLGAGGEARSTATLSEDGLLYLPARTMWVQGNGNGDAPSQQIENLFNAFDLSPAPEIVLPPPAAQRGRPLNHTILVRWKSVADPASQFSHYAIYRATTPFTNVTGMTPVGTVSNVLATSFLDTTAVNGTAYYYYVTTVTITGQEAKAASVIGGFRPYDESDLQVVSISRTPRFPRYAADYSSYEITEPSGFGPYYFSAATGLGNGQTTNTQRWPATNDPVTYTATVRNRGSNPWTNTIAGAWQWDGVPVSPAGAPGPFAPDATATFTLVHPWDGMAHEVRFVLTHADARPGNNTVAINTKSVPYLTYMDESYYENFRFQTPSYPHPVTDDLVDWIQLHMARFNQMFSNAACLKRVHYDVLEFLVDGTSDPTTDTGPFGVFPFRFRAGEGTYRESGYYRPDEDIDYGYLHEMGHQLGLIDIYQMDVSPDMNQVSSLPYAAPADLMNGCSPFLSPQSALGMNHWLDQAHGYFGQYLYGIPAEVRMRFVTRAGKPLSGAVVKMYQLQERPGAGKVISTQIKAQGITDTNGVFVLPNVPIDPAKVPPLPTGDALRANPFGYVAVIGANGLLHFRLEFDGAVAYAWLDLPEVNTAYYQGLTHQATFERTVTLGGPIQRFPPTELTETNAADWVPWAEGGASGGSTATDDATNRVVGLTALKFVTDGGFDTAVRYPGTFNAQWDLAGVSALNVSFHAQNPNGGFQGASPWIRLKDGDGNFLQYQFFLDGSPVDLLNEAEGNWKSYQIPLDASPTEDNGWRRTAFGTPSLSRITSLEIHADTWGYGFTLWLDGVSFQPALRPALQFAAQAGGLTVSWPASTPAPVLEAADIVTGPYLPVGVTPAETGGVSSVAMPFSGGQRYFRLRMP